MYSVMLSPLSIPHFQNIIYLNKVQSRIVILNYLKWRDVDKAFLNTCLLNQGIARVSVTVETLSGSCQQLKNYKRTQPPLSQAWSFQLFFVLSSKNRVIVFLKLFVTNFKLDNNFKLLVKFFSLIPFSLIGSHACPVIPYKCASLIAFFLFLKPSSLFID